MHGYYYTSLVLCLANCCRYTSGAGGMVSTPIGRRNNELILQYAVSLASCSWPCTETELGCSPTADRTVKLVAPIPFHLRLRRCSAARASTAGRLGGRATPRAAAGVPLGRRRGRPACRHPRAWRSWVRSGLGRGRPRRGRAQRGRPEVGAAAAWLGRRAAPRTDARETGWERSEKR
jgi:hypothetical protein